MPASAPWSGVESGSFMQRLGAATPVDATIALIARPSGGGPDRVGVVGHPLRHQLDVSEPQISGDGELLGPPSSGGARELAGARGHEPALHHAEAAFQPQPPSPSLPVKASSTCSTRTCTRIRWHS